MNHRKLCLGSLLVTFFSLTVSAQQSTPALTQGEMEAAYTAAIQARASNIISHLELTDAAKAARVSEIITSQYRALRARDEFINAAVGLEATDWTTQRAQLLDCLGPKLHNRFLTRLGAELTPAQVEIVKDRMTYNKVQVTYNAYCEIVPGLTDKDKETILALLKAAREAAMDGGSVNEKNEVFQKYKNQINTYLNANGHDVAKATQEWEAKKAQASAK